LTGAKSNINLLYQKFENWLLVTVTMERADRVGGKDGNTVALLQNMECPDVHKKMSFQISVYRNFFFSNVGRGFSPAT